jgi:TfoX/Sxy family transcriptional regulator of competence genes
MLEEAYIRDPALALLNEIAADYGGEPEVKLGTMFASPGLRVNGKIFAFLGRDRRLIVKVPGRRAQESLETGAAQAVTMGKRTMKEWIALPLNEDDADGTLATWRLAAREAHDYVTSLPTPS